MTALDAKQVRMNRVGGVCALGIVGAYVITIALFAHVGAPPSSGAALLKYLAGKTTEWWAILALSVLTDFLFVPVGLSLFLALERVNRNVMVVATAFGGLFVVLDIAVTWANYASLITLEGQYAAATTDAQRAALVAAANYPAAILASPLAVVAAIVDLSFAILLIGLVMRNGLVFSRTTAYVGIVTGILGLISITGWSVTIILNALLATLWLFLVGYRLYRT